MTTEKEVRLSYNELTRLVWICQHCGAEQNLDISSDKQVKELYGEKEKLCYCGVCSQPCDSALFYAFRDLKEFYKRVDELHRKQSSINVFFRVSVNNKEEEPKQ
jgi:hypothetical protein